jgi:hypothetical protein
MNKELEIESKEKKMLREAWIKDDGAEMTLTLITDSIVGRTVRRMLQIS